MSIHVEVITPESVAFKKEVDFIAAPAIDGQVGILPGHAPLLTPLGLGELRLVTDGQTHSLAITGGFLEVKPGSEVAIFAETAEMAEEIDIEKEKIKAEEAKSKLQDSRDLTAEEFAEVERSLAHSIMRMKVGQIRKLRRPGAGAS